MRSCARLLAQREPAVPPPALRAHIMAAVAHAPPPRTRAAPVIRLPSWRRAAVLSSTAAVAAALALAALNVQWRPPTATERPLPRGTIAAHTVPALTPAPEPVATQPPATPAAELVERPTDAAGPGLAPRTATKPPRRPAPRPALTEPAPAASVAHEVADLNVIRSGAPLQPLENASSSSLSSLGEPSEREPSWTVAAEPGAGLSEPSPDDDMGAG
jgi:hypothetical protein